MGIDAHAAFRSAVWQIDGCVLDRHPGGERHDFGKGDILMEAHPAFSGAARSVVLNAVPLKMRDGAVIQLNRYVDNQRFFWDVSASQSSGIISQDRGQPDRPVANKCPTGPVYLIEDMKEAHFAVA